MENAHRSVQSPSPRFAPLGPWPVFRPLFPIVFGGFWDTGSDDRGSHSRDPGRWLSEFGKAQSPRSFASVDGASERRTAGPRPPLRSPPMRSGGRPLPYGPADERLLSGLRRRDLRVSPRSPICRAQPLANLTDKTFCMKESLSGFRTSDG